jgi:type I restriction enzyme, R subunit
VHRVVTEWDAAGWRPTKEEIDRYGRTIPDDEYQTKDFERVVAMRARTEAIAKHLADFMQKNDRFAKTIVFCVDQEHASEMATALGNLNKDLRITYPDYVARVTADEGDIGRGHLGRFQDVEKKTPVILTTSQLLTTGVDAPTCKNVVLARVVGSMSEFKQIIGRGTRVRDDYGKLWFNILDYTGSATRLFADPDFDGNAARITEEEIDREGTVIQEIETQPEIDGGRMLTDGPREIIEPPPDQPRKYYFDGGQVAIAAHIVQELDPNGNVLRTVRYTDYASSTVRSLFPTSRELRVAWADSARRAEIIASLRERGIDFEALGEALGQPEADPLDLVCHLAFNAPLRTRRERAEALRSTKPDFFSQYGGQRPHRTASTTWQQAARLVYILHRGKQNEQRINFKRLRAQPSNPQLEECQG